MVSLSADRASAVDPMQVTKRPLRISEQSFGLVSMVRRDNAIYDGIETCGIISCIVPILVDPGTSVFMAHLLYNQIDKADVVLSMAGQQKYPKAYIAHNVVSEDWHRRRDLKKLAEAIKRSGITNDVSYLPLSTTSLSPLFGLPESSIGIDIDGVFYKPQVQRFPPFGDNWSIRERSIVGPFVDMNLYYELVRNPSPMLDTPLPITK